MGDWIKGADTAQLDISARLKIDIGNHISNYQNPASGVHVSFGTTRLDISKTDHAITKVAAITKYAEKLVIGRDGVGLPGMIYGDVFCVSVQSSCPIAYPHTYTATPFDLSGGAGIMKAGYYIFVAWTVTGESYWLDLDGTVTGNAWRLWSKWTSSPPSGKYLKYWWECTLEDGWLEDWDGDHVGTLGTVELSWHRTSDPPVGWTPGTPSPHLSVGLSIRGGFASVDHCLGYNTSEWARVEVGVTAAHQSLAEEYVDYGSGWEIIGDTTGVSLYHTSTGHTDWWNNTWSKTLSLYAYIDPTLQAFYPGNPTDAGGPSPTVRISTGVPEQSTDIDKYGSGVVVTAAPAGMFVKAGHALTVTTDIEWAQENEEYATDGTLTNLRWRLEAHPPQLGRAGSPYWTNAFKPQKWSGFRLQRGTRVRVPFLANPFTAATPTLQQWVEETYFVKWDKSRWGVPTDFAAGGMYAAYYEYDDDTSGQTFSIPVGSGLTEFTLQRPLFSYFADRNASVRDLNPDTVVPPDVYRFTSANWYWEYNDLTEPRYEQNDGTDPGDDFPPNMTRPEDFYDFTSWRYLGIQVTTPRAGITLRVTVNYSLPTITDPHTTGSDRTENYEISWAAQEAVFEQLLPAMSGEVLFDLWQLDPKPRLVTQLTFAFSDLEEEDEVVLGLVGMAQDFEATVHSPDRDDYGEESTVVKWGCHWSGLPVMVNARTDDTPSLDVLEGYGMTRETKACPYIEYLFGAETGTDLCHALTMEQVMNICEAFEGWSGTWSQDIWDAMTTYTDDDGVVHRLSPGYPWDAAWLPGSAIDPSETDVFYACIGVLSWSLAAALSYDLHSGQFFRGRLDGLLSVNDIPSRDAVGILRVENKRGDTEWTQVGADFGSDGHGSWWTPPLPEQGWNEDDEEWEAYSVRLKIKSGSSWIVCTTGWAVGIGEWVWVGIVRRTTGDRIDAVSAHWPGILIAHSKDVTWPSESTPLTGLCCDTYKTTHNPALYEFREQAANYRCPAVATLPTGRTIVVATDPASSKMKVRIGECIGREVDVEMEITGYSFPTLALPEYGDTVQVLARNTGTGKVDLLQLDLTDASYEVVAASIADCDEMSAGLVANGKGELVAVVPTGGKMYVYKGTRDGRTWEAVV
ncbi:MAG TPA: hypothetical protein PLF11_00190 [Bacillota bacterium]|nr:hypothetical protein [Dermatophilaceae bacterium]HOI35777.1 hypothetical protein [Bacillota bacterium]